MIIKLNFSLFLQAQEMAKELEGQIQNLKHALQDSEQFKVRELRVCYDLTTFLIAIRYINLIVF